MKRRIEPKATPSWRLKGLFLWLPLQIKNDWRWLEFVTIKQSFHGYLRDGDEIWSDDAFVDVENA